MVSDFKDRVFKASPSITRSSAPASVFQATLLRVSGNAYLGSKQLVLLKFCLLKYLRKNNVVWQLNNFFTGGHFTKYTGN